MIRRRGRMRTALVYAIWSSNKWGLDLGPFSGGRPFRPPRTWFSPTTLCGVLVFDSVSRSSSPSASSSRRPPVTHNTTLSHTHTHTFVNHHLSHTIFHTPSLSTIFHTPSFTHHLCQLSLSTTIFHLSHTTQLCHTPSFTHNCVNLCQPSSTHHLCQPSLSTTIFHLSRTTELCHTPSFTHNLYTQLCQPPSFTHPLSHTIFHTPSLSTIFHTPSSTHHLSHIIFVNHLCRTLFHVAGVAGFSRRWRRGTLRGKRGTWSHPPSFHVAGVALGHIHLRFAWQAWHLWHWVARLGRFQSPVTPRHFAWQAWHVVTSTFVSCGRRGTWSHPPSFCVAGMALRALGWLWWHAWAGFSRRWLRGTSRGRRSTWSHPPSFCVADVALMALGWLWWRAWAGFSRWWRRGILRGRRGTWSHPPPFHVAGLALGHIHLRFPWRGTYGTGLALQITTLSHTIIVTRHFWHTIFHTPLCHTPSLTLNFVTRHLLHTALSHHLSHNTCHTPSLTQLCHTPSLTHDFVTHNLSHTIFDIPSFTHHRCPTPFLTHDCVTHHFSHTICDTPSFTHHLCHTPSFIHHLSHTIFDPQLCHTPSLTHHLSHTTFSPTIFDTPSFTHHFVIHHLSHTTLSHTPSFTHHLVTHHLWHTIFHTPLCLTPSFTHHLSPHHLSHTILSYTNFVTHSLSHTTFTHTPSFTRNFVTHSHTIFLCHTPSFTYNLVTHTHTKLCFTSRSSTTSFVFPSFPVPATTFGAHYWKKLPCGVIRSFHFLPKESWLSLELCSSLSEKKCESREQSHIGWCYLSLIARIHWVFLDTSFAWPLSSLKCLPSFAGQNRVSKISRPEKNQVARPILQHRAHHPRLLTRHYLLSFTCCSACCTLHIVHHFCNTRTMWYLIPSSSWQLSLTATSEPLECRITQQLVTPSCVSPVLSQACQRMPYTDLH